MFLKLLLKIQMIWMNKKCKTSIVFNEMIADMFSNKNLVTELFIRGRKLNISLVFITQSYFSVQTNIRINSTHYFMMKIPNNRTHQQTAFNCFSDTEFQDVRNIYKKCTTKPYSSLVIDTSLTSENPLRFRNIFLERI